MPELLTSDFVRSGLGVGHRGGGGEEKVGHGGRGGGGRALG